MLTRFLKMEETLVKNLERKRPLIDQVKLTNKGPLLSFIDLNTGEFCNRKCVFCPRVNPDNYPNQKLLRITLALLFS